MEFYKFQSACKFSKYTYTDPDDHTRISAVCSNNVPPSRSHRICDEAHCPHFGVKIKDISIYCDGKLVGKAESGKVFYDG